MKKLMKKKVSFLGKEVSVFVVVLVGMVALASATLVPYLSGVVTGDVTVNHPFKANIASGLISNEASVTDTSISLGNISGGDVVNATIRFQYLGTNGSGADVQEVFMINNSGITCGDFDSIEFNSGNGWGDILSVPGWCTQYDSDSVLITDPSGSNHYDAGEINLVQASVNFKLNAYGTYVMTGQIYPIGSF